MFDLATARKYRRFDMTDLNKEIQSILRTAVAQSGERMDSWNKISSLGGLFDGRPEFLIDLQDLSQLDCLLVSMEDAELLPTWHEANMFLRNLSRNWVGQAYELLRALKQRVLSQKKDARPFEWADELEELFVVLETVRVMLFKRELAKAGKKGRGLTSIDQHNADGEPAPPYVHGQSILSEHVFKSPNDNSIGWLVYGPNYPSEGLIVFRRVISDNFLAKFASIKLTSFALEK